MSGDPSATKRTVTPELPSGGSAHDSSPDDDLRPREERLHKVNELLNHLSSEQRRSLTSRLTRNAPDLVTSGARDQPIDTPMRRARSIARALLKRERKAALTRGVHGSNSGSGLELVSLEGVEGDESQRDRLRGDQALASEPDAPPPPPLRALLRLTPAKLLKAYQVATLPEWLMALKIAEPEVKEHLIFNLPPRVASELEAALRDLGPVKLGEAQELEVSIRRRVKRALSGTR